MDKTLDRHLPMKMTHILVLLIALVFSALPSWAGGKAPEFIISFHEEGDKIEGERRVHPLPIAGETRYFRKIPFLMHVNVKAYWPFRAADGQSWGAVFWLDDSGRLAVQRLGNLAVRNQYLAAAVNRVPVDSVRINNGPEDGKLVIWQGLDPALFPAFDKKFRRIKGGNESAHLAGAGGTLPAATPVKTTAPDGSPIHDLAAADAAKKKAAKWSKKPAVPAAPTGNPVKDASLGPDFHEPLSPAEFPKVMELPEPVKPSR
jgi:hypothetical protein